MKQVLSCMELCLTEDLMKLSQEALNTDSKSVNPSFNLDTSVKSDDDFMVESFCENWVLQLGRDDMVSLALFLTFQLSKHFDCGTTKAAELAGLMVGWSDRAVREWKSQFFENSGCIPESEQGKYERSGVVWRNEHLNKKAAIYIRSNSNVKGSPNRPL